jgi:pyruvate/2-oxoglutarate dehydrogenase complex dihydrolipoamide dehydrogenase (E3) component
MLVAQQAARKGRSVAVVTLVSGSDTHFDRLVHQLDGSSPFVENGANDLTRFEGPCRFLSPTSVRAGDSEIKARRIVLASGCLARRPDIPSLNDGTAMSALERLDRHEKLSTIIVGAGPVAVGLAFRLRTRGDAVRILGRSGRVLSKHEPEVSVAVADALESAGIEFSGGVRDMSVSWSGSRASAAFQLDGHATRADAEALVFATGLTPATHELDLAKAEIVLDRNGRVVTNDEMRTSSPSVWAVGPVTAAAPSLSLHTHQAALAAHNLEAPFFDKMRFVPGETATIAPGVPPVASIGLTEETARALYKDVASATARWKSDGAGVCLLKILGRRRNGEILGAHALAPAAAETVSFFGLARRAGVSLYDLVEGHHYATPSPAEIIPNVVRMWVGD